MILFHGTSNNHNENIMRKGLLPRRKRKSNWEAPFQAKTPRDFVYLTNNQFNAQFYALRAAIANSCPEGLVVKIADCHKLEDNFYPDENYLVGNNCVNKSISLKEMKAAQKKIKKNKDAWKECWEQKGMLTHRGRINKTYLADMEVIPNVDNPFFFLAGDSIAEFDRRFHALLQANRHFSTPGTVYYDKIKEYQIIKMGKMYECHIPCHGVIDVVIKW